MRKIRRFKALILTLCVLGPIPALAEEAVPTVSAETAILVEAESGQVLFGKDPDKAMKGASTVKIMTALLALEALEPSETVTVRQEWTGCEGSSMYLRAGQELTVRELLTGLLLCSGNDAAQALACLVSGSEEAFVKRMNEKARELGMANAVFTDASGLCAEGHSITARDLALLTGEAMRHPLFRELVSCKTAEAGGQSLRNHNKLLWRDGRVIGVKTGYTRAAGRTLVSAAEDKGMTLICVTLNDPCDWEDHLRLLDWGFRAYAKTDPASLRFSVPVVSGVAETVTAVPAEMPTLLEKSGEALRWVPQLPKFVYAPVRRGDPAGTATAYALDGTEAGSVPLIWEKTVPLAEGAELNFWEKLKWSWYFTCRHSTNPMPYVYY